MENDKLKKTILLVDDDVDYLYQTETMLKAAGFNVITAESQEDAELILKATKPDLVLSDLMMESLDAGFSFSYHVKKVDPKIPVIIVTGVANETGMKLFNGSEEERSWIKADAILSKPIKYDQLIKEINKYLD
jgi:CheY-like chemotaxis protein